MFTNYQWLIIGVIIACSCLVVYGSSSTNIKHYKTYTFIMEVFQEAKNALKQAMTKLENAKTKG